MKRVASLYLPHWPIDRLRRSEPRRISPTPPPEAEAGAALLALTAQAAAEHGGKQCDAPKNTGWRPGARWARSDKAALTRDVAAVPAHQRPPMRLLGRSSEAAEMPFRRLPSDDGAPFRAMPPDEVAAPSYDPASLRHASAMPAIRYPGDGPHPDKHTRRGSNDPHSAPPGVAAFFDTGRSTAGTLARVCPEQGRIAATASDDAAPALVTVEKVGTRVQLAAVSPAAQALGLVPGMALTQARASVPGLAVHPADRAGDRVALERLAVLLARRCCPIVALSGDDGLLLDLTGVAHLHGGEARLAHYLRRLLARFGFDARIAIADTAGAAWALARHQSKPVLLLPPGEQRAALTPLPAAALRLDDGIVELLTRLGIDTVGALAALPPGPLVRRCGTATFSRLAMALGDAPEPLDPVMPGTAIMVEQRFAEPIATPEAIAHWLGRLVPHLCQELAAAGRGARALVLAGARVDGAMQLLRIGLARPTRDLVHILRLIARRIEELEPGYGFDALALHVLRADPLAAEALGAALAGDADAELAPLVDVIANRIDPERLWRVAAVESDVPERSVARCPPLDPSARAAKTLRRDDVRQLDQRSHPHPWHPRWPRPARLLARPERLDNVMAELPDKAPVRFSWRGITHRVIRADGPERIVGEWWRRRAEREAVRDYFQVEDEDGRRFWLFRRGDGERAVTGDLSWYMHGAFA